MENIDKRKILIVDDEPRSLYAMELLLSQEPYNIFFADCGQKALAEVDKIDPDVLLLDVMMPDITGFEVCQHLKQDERWRHIPIILVTALDRKEDLISGLEAGADEFLSKPVHGPELRARVRTMLRIKKQYDELEEMLQLREDMADMIVHDMRTPISSLLLYTDLLDHPHSVNLSEEKLTGKIRLQAHRLNSFLGDLLLLAKMRSGKLVLNREPQDPRDLIHTAAHQYQEIAASREIALVTRLPDEPRILLLDRNLMLRVFENLISNALKFSPRNSTVSIYLNYPTAEPEAAPGQPALRFRIIDEGPGIPEEFRERIFDKYEIIEAKQEGMVQVGLGLALCKLVVDAHGGQIYVQDNRPGGAVFTVEI